MGLAAYNTVVELYPAPEPEQTQPTEARIDIFDKNASFRKVDIGITGKLVTGLFFGGLVAVLLVATFLPVL